jgi:HK97 family phage portal protein
MTLKTKTAALLQKTVSLLSAPFRLSDAAGFRSALGNLLVNKDTGQCVTLDSALTLSVVFACVKLTAETVATLPCIVYRRKPKGRAVAADHWLYALLHDSPNADQIAVEFWEELVANLMLRGRAYVYAPRDVNDQAIELRVLDFSRMGTPRVLANGSIIYPYNHPVKGMQEYTDREIWVPKGFGGLSVIQYGARSMGGAMSAERAGAKLYSNDLRPVAVVTRDEILTQGQRKQVKEAIADGMMSSIEGGPLRLIEGGMKYQQLSLTAEDAQLLETMQFKVEDLCRWFGMNPSMIGHGTAVSNWGTGREQINLGFLQYVLRAYTKRLEQGISKWLLRSGERGRIYAEFSVEGLLRADSAGRAAFYSTMVQNGIMTRNEVRDLENLDEKDGGDELTVQSNLVPAKMLGKTTTAAGNAIDALKAALGIGSKEHET